MTTSLHERLVSLAAGTILDVGPADAVSVAAAAGWPAVGVWFDPDSWTDATTAEVARRLDGTGLVALDIEPVILGPDGDPGERLVEAAVAIGARHVLVASRIADVAAVADRFAALCDLALPAGVVPVLEFLPIFGIRTLTEAAAAVVASGRAGGVLVDTLHLVRSGGTPADLAAVVAQGDVAFPYLQVADAPAPARVASGATAAPPDIGALVEEALHGRLLIGDGVLPVREVVDALPGRPLSFELRSRVLRERHPDPTERARAVLANWRAVAAAG